MESKTRRGGLKAQSPFSSPPAYSLQPRAYSFFRAFTLIEMVVVVAIIGLLMAISIPVSMGLINSQKAKTTSMTMQALDLAINTFASEKPINGNTPLETGLTYAQVFGAFPPSPVTPQVLNTASPQWAKWGLSGFAGQPGFLAKDSGTKWRFEDLVRRFLVPQPAAGSWYYDDNSSWHTTDLRATDKHLTIETPVLFLRQLSPQANRSLDRLQKFVTNGDQDNIEWDADGISGGPPFTTDLFEITDSWGTPLRYAVQSPVLTDEGRLPIRWELRSAGPDKTFAPTFNADASFVNEDQAGDDVILRGP